MARSRWIAALVAVLACTASAWAQLPQQERIVTIQETNKPAQKCRVLKCWKEKDGSKVREIQAIGSGEMMTILEPVSVAQFSVGGRTGTISKIFRWSDKTRAASGRPTAPANAWVVGEPNAQRSLLGRLFGPKEKATDPVATKESTPSSLFSWLLGRSAPAPGTIAPVPAPASLTRLTATPASTGEPATVAEPPVLAHLAAMPFARARNTASPSSPGTAPGEEGYFMIAGCPGALARLPVSAEPSPAAAPPPKTTSWTLIQQSDGGCAINPAAAPPSRTSPRTVASITLSSDSSAAPATVVATLDLPAMLGIARSSPPEDRSPGCGNGAGESPSASACFRLWGAADYLLWWTKNSPEPVPLAAPRPLSLGGTVTFGGRDIDTQDHSGARFTVGGWFTEDSTLGAEASYFFLASKGATLQHVPGNREGLPFVNAVTGPTRFPFADPTLDTARETVTLSQFLQGCTVSGIVSVVAENNFRLDLLGGFRYLDLSEDLGFRIDLAGVPTAAAPGFAGSYRDQFNARNQFYGANLGVRGEARWNSWFVNGTAQAALGDVHERLSIGGFSTQSGGGNVFVNAAFPGRGVFAQQTNGGVFLRDRIAVLPEGAINLGYEFSSRIRASLGYSFLYVSDVIRPGAQMSPVVNTSNVPFFGGAPGPLVGPSQPLPTGRGSDFWAQGLTFCLEFRY